MISLNTRETWNCGLYVECSHMIENIRTSHISYWDICKGQPNTGGRMQ